MAISTGRMKVFIEVEDGTIYNLDGLATDVQLTHRTDLIDVSSYANPGATIRGMRSIEFSIHGVCTSDVITTKEVSAMRTAAEWKCTYCGRPNKRQRETCKSCGAVRSFLYG
jgi:hypothetical protein